MARWKPESQSRLEQAARELFIEKGFEQTTVAEIAERAGLTERTFFRYFDDKREVLFAGSEQFQESFVNALVGQPLETPAFEAVARSIEPAAKMLQTRAQFAQERQIVIAAHPELQERELIKLAKVTDALAATLRERGVDEPLASLSAQMGMSVFHVAFQQWIKAPQENDLLRLVRESFTTLHQVSAL